MLAVSRTVNLLTGACVRRLLFHLVLRVALNWPVAVRDPTCMGKSLAIAARKKCGFSTSAQISDFVGEFLAKIDEQFEVSPVCWEMELEVDW